ncbi:uncharacterized protein [Periplaneta americana]|uniref:uncharacterized protein n=1 Tax=Periplaneta americana TaxID=6978 RepID=UPI0037E93404
MKAEVIGWVVTAVGTPIVIVTLCWTLVIFHYHRHAWRSTDLLLAAILSQGVVKQVATFAYTILTLLQALDSSEAWCSGVVWLITSIHVLQAATLATLTFSRLLAVRSPVRYRQAVKRTHIVYHLVSLSILSSCIGVAAVLAEGKPGRELGEDDNSTVTECTFLPHAMDRRYAVLSITLHSLLDITSIVALIVTLFSWCCLYRRHKANMSVSQPSTIISKRGERRRQLMTSTSDLSASFEGLRPNSRSAFLSDCSADTLKPKSLGCEEDASRWTSESSYISTSTSSTNSRAPCLANRPNREEDLRLQSVLPVLALCYIVNHLPVLSVTVLGMFAPWLLPRVWSLPALVLWAGLAEECLLPVLLALCDRNFTTWVANIYTCRDRRVADLARQHQGLDGKFRVFSTQSLQVPEVQTPNPLQHQQQEPAKFPITNGSLFTSVDGRLPIIHNYRRGKGMRTTGVLPPPQIANVGLTKRHELLHMLINLNAAALENQHFKQRLEEPQNFAEKSCEFQPYLPKGMDSAKKKVTHQVSQTGNTKPLLSDLEIGKITLKYQTSPSEHEDDFNSEEYNEYNVDDDDDDDDNDDEPIYATLSSHSCCSVTTAANDDFEFFQHEEKITKLIDSTANELSQAKQNNFGQETPSDDSNSSQSLLYRYQREMKGDRSRQLYRAVDWTVDPTNEVFRLVLPKLEPHHSQNNCETPPQANHAGTASHSQAVTQDDGGEQQKETNKCRGSRKGSVCSSHDIEPETNIDDVSSSFERETTDSEDLQSARFSDSSPESQNVKLPVVTNMTRKKQSTLAGAFSLNNLDELIIEEKEEEIAKRSRRERASPHERTNNATQSEFLDDRQVVFELPVKSESALGLYRLDLDRSSTPAALQVQHLYKYGPAQPRSLGEQTPPTRRLPVPVLSVESLTTALNCAQVSYLDNGDLCRHGSVPDLKRVFVSDYI